MDLSRYELNKRRRKFSTDNSFKRETSRSSFDTQKKDSEKKDISQYFDEIKTYIESFNNKLNNYLLYKENGYKKMYQKFIDTKQQELKEINKHIDNAIGGTSELFYNESIKKGNLEREKLENSFNVLSATYKVMEANCNKFKIQLERLKEDNDFLRRKLRSRIEENNNVQLLLKSLVKNIENFKSLLATCSTLEEKANSSLAFLDIIHQSLKGVQAKGVSFEFALESLIESNELKKEAVKRNAQRIVINAPKSRCSSVVKSKDDNKFANKLVKKNKQLEKKVSYLKSKMGTIVYQRHDLEEIFIECINATKLNILSKHNCSTQFGNSLLVNNDAVEKNLSNIKLKNLSNEDKINILKLFVSNEKVIEYIYSAIFPKHSEFLPSINQPQQH